MANPFRKVIENPERLRRPFEKIATRVEKLSDEMSKLTDDQLKQKTNEFRDRLKKGETLDDLEVEAFAVVREADKRVLGLYPYRVQIIGSAVLHDGNIAEMKTGEGKTLTATMAVYLNALPGKGVHVVTVNDYLSKRDREEIGPVYEWLGLSVGLANENHDEEDDSDEKRAAYASDVVFVTNSAIGFDYLRDNMAPDAESRIMNGLNFAIVDEVDSVLVDTARTPLIIAGQGNTQSQLFARADRFVKILQRNDDFEVDEEAKSVNLTDSGISKAEEFFGLTNLYSSENIALTHHIDQALRANYAYLRGREYVVAKDKEGKEGVFLIDQSTGRVLEGSRMSDGLHQAMEVKEGVEIQAENRSIAQITYQNMFRMYKKLAGMTGTAATEAEEFREIYNMQVVPIPTNQKVQRVDRPDVLYPSLRSKFNAVVEMIKELHIKGQPILVGTASVDNSELLSKMLTAVNIPHNVLNAKNVAREAEIIANAGQRGAVTVATNMAGRGTDIKLGPGVAELGGLAVIGTERHESRRIDNQLRGRSGRQGDKGFSQFFLSLEDDLMVRFGAERIKDLLERFNLDEKDSVLDRPWITRSVESAQKRVEGNNYDSRKNVLQYDDIMRQQRDLIYEQRNEVLDETESLNWVILPMVKRTIHRVVEANVKGPRRDWNIDAIIDFASNALADAKDIHSGEFNGKNPEELEDQLYEIALQTFDKQSHKIVDAEELLNFERVVLLRSLDMHWMDHIDNLQRAQQAVSLRSYAQLQPLLEYQALAYDTFNEMIATVEYDVTRMFMKAEIRQNLRTKKKQKA